MQRHHLKFIIGISIILSTLTWLAFSGFKEGKAYYVTITELKTMKAEGKSTRVRVAGEVTNGSIQRKGTDLYFTIHQSSVVPARGQAAAVPDRGQEILSLPVHYIGRDPVPDTFKEGGQAVVEGTLDNNGIFLAQKIQAKCASKYEAEQKTKKSSIATEPYVQPR